MTLRLRLVLLAIISMLCMIAATWLWLGKIQHETRIAKLQDEHNGWAHACSTLIHYLQRERGYSASGLARQQYDTILLTQYRKDTDGALHALLENSLTTSERLMRSNLTDLSQALSDVRLQFSGQRAGWRETRDGYTGVVSKLLSAIQFELGNRETEGLIDSQRTLGSIAELALAREALGLIRATVNVIKAGDHRLAQNDLAFITSQFALYQNHLRNFEKVADTRMLTQMQSVRTGGVYQWVMSVVDQLVVSGTQSRELDPDNKWWNNASSVIYAEKAIEDKAYAELEHLTSEEIARQIQLMTAMSFGAAILVIGLASFVWLTIIWMMRDLRTLSKALNEVVTNENYTVRLPTQGRDDELSHAFTLFNKLLEFTDSLLREKEKLASLDTLTGIMNRRSLLKFAQRELSRAGRYAQNLSLIFLDIDHFKRVNDNFGHNVGDEVLQTFARIIKERTRDTDIVARLGGEEFIVLVPESDLEGTRILAEHLREAVAGATFPTVDKVTCSLGVAQWRKGETFEALCARADNALYVAKENGRNQVSVNLVPDTNEQE